MKYDDTKDSKPVDENSLVQTLHDPRTTPAERLIAGANLGLQPTLSTTAKLAVSEALKKEQPGSVQRAMLMNVLAAHNPSAFPQTAFDTSLAAATIE